MKAENIINALGMINDEVIRDAKEPEKVKRPVWTKWMAIVACLCLVVVVAIPVILHDREPATDIEKRVELTLEEATNDATFGNLFPTQILAGYVLEDSVGIYGDPATVLQANFYNAEIEDELVIKIANREYFATNNDFVLDTVLYCETTTGKGSYIYIEGGEYVAYYSFRTTDIAEMDEFYSMVFSAKYFK